MAVGLTDTLMGYKIKSNLSLMIRKQVRFGKSKRKRLRRKQAKKPENWAVLPDPKVYVIGEFLVGHPDTIARIIQSIQFNPNPA